ncbi:MAG: fibronectin type III domain-containing protein [Planctomycetes bacterium]|nr:fibronectin type III domain-containing protein [Planctomycetota bacterium]
MYIKLIKFIPILILAVSLDEWDGNTRVVATGVSSTTPNFFTMPNYPDVITTFSDQNTRIIKARIIKSTSILKPGSGAKDVLEQPSENALLTNPSIAFKPSFFTNDPHFIFAAQSKEGNNNSTIWVSELDSELVRLIQSSKEILSSTNADLIEPKIFSMWGLIDETTTAICYKEHLTNDRTKINIKGILMDENLNPIPQSELLIANDRSGMGEVRSTVYGIVSFIPTYWESRIGNDPDIRFTILVRDFDENGNPILAISEEFEQYQDGLVALGGSGDQTTPKASSYSGSSTSLGCLDNGNVVVTRINHYNPQTRPTRVIDDALNFIDYNICDSWEGKTYITAITSNNKIKAYKLDEDLNHMWSTGGVPGITVTTNNNKPVNTQIVVNDPYLSESVAILWTDEINGLNAKEIKFQILRQDGEISCTGNPNGIKIIDNPVSYYTSATSGSDVICTALTSGNKVEAGLLTNNCTNQKPNILAIRGTLDFEAGEITLDFTIPDPTIANEIKISKSINGVPEPPITIPIAQTYIDTSVPTEYEQFSYSAKSTKTSPYSESDETEILWFDYLRGPDRLAGHEFVTPDTPEEGILLTWQDNSPNETGFIIERKINQGTFITIGRTDADEMYFFIPEHPIGNETWTFQVRAIQEYEYSNTTILSAYSPTITINSSGSSAPLTAPINLALTLSGTTVNLSWEDTNSDPYDEDGFVIEHSTDGIQFSELTRLDPSVTSFQHTNPVLNSSNYYRVYTYKGSNNSSYTRVLGEYISGGGISPNAPSNLNGTYSAQSKVNLTWVDNSNNEDGFVVERKEGNLNFSELRRINTPNTTTYNDTTVESDKIYIYRVKAFNTNGDSPYSNEKSISTSTSGGGTTLPDPPTNLRATYLRALKKVSLIWVDNSNNETEFVVERRDDISPNPIFTGIHRTSLPNIVQWDDPNILENSMYTYRVSAYNARGNSAYSNEVTIRTSNSGGGKPPIIIIDPPPQPINPNLPKPRVKRKPEPTCFIATASSASPQSALPATLSRFRNNYFYKNTFTLTGIKSYSELSPKLAKSISRSTTLQAISENLLGNITIIFASIGIFIISFLLIKLKRF